MSMRRRAAKFRAGCAVAAATGLVAMVAAQSARSVLDGVYSDEQGARGKKLYVESCASCHQEGLQGADLAPALKGEDFILKWAGSSMQDFFTKVATTMPADAPGTLTPQVNADIVAFILQVNKFPAGHDELKPDAPLLKAIAITPRTPAP
jgi:mono/diheme cytochrome c family protein